MKKLLFYFILFYSFSSYANFSAEQINDVIVKNSNLSKAEKIQVYASLFLGKSYLLSPLGEADYDVYDKDPIYRFEAFDCTTYVETVYALYFSNNFKDFEKNMQQIRYSGNNILFIERNHIPSVDWIANNVKKGYLKDITKNIFKDNTKTLNLTIDKQGWYNKFGLSTIKNDKLNDYEKEKLLPALKKEGNSKFKNTIDTSLPYVEISYVLSNPKVLSKVPSGSIVNIVRLNWNIQPIIGTNLAISHQGIIIQEDGKTMFYNASSTSGSVEKILFIDYLKSTLSSKTIKGLNFLNVS